MASDPAKAQPPRTRGTTTKSFGTGSRENHDAWAFYSRNLAQAKVSSDILTEVHETNRMDPQHRGDTELPTGSVALMVTSPPYHAGPRRRTTRAKD